MKYLILLSFIGLASCSGNGAGSDVKPTVNNVDDKASYNNGETLFTANCASCHKPNQDYVGPALKGVTARWPSKELMYEFIRNSQDVISRNDYAKQLYIKYNQSPMLPYPNLSNSDIADILNYCDKYSK